MRLADREKGKFRTFLLAMLDYFLAREWKREHRQKRGGQFTFISLDEETPEERYRFEPEDNDTPEKKFLRQWAMNVVQQTMSALEAECEANGNGTLFRETRSFLSGERDGTAYSEISQRLNMGEGAARMAVHRLRQRYGELLRHEIAQTVSGPEEVDEEMRRRTRLFAMELKSSSGVRLNHLQPSPCSTPKQWWAYARAWLTVEMRGSATR